MDEQSYDDSKQLKRIHEDFLKNPYFTVHSVMTPSRKWIYMDTSGRDLNEKKELAKRNDLFNLVVRENDKTVGMDPVGIATFWDLNRAPLYMLSYTMLVYLEHTLLLAIKDSHKNWTDHKYVLDAFKNKKQQDLVTDFLGNGKDNKGYNYKALSYWGLPELLTFYKVDKDIDKNNVKISDQLIELFSGNDKFRNRIAHSVKLLVEDKDETFQSDLKKLYTILEEGSNAFLKFIDPKLRYNTPSADDYLR